MSAIPKKLKFLPSAGRDLVKLREFIAVHNPEAAAKAARCILVAAQRLEQHALLGRLADDMLGHHDLVIPFGAAGYILRYRIEGNMIFVVGIRHGKEDSKGESTVQTVGVRELKNRLTYYLGAVKGGENVVVTDRGKPVAIMHGLEKIEDDAGLDERLAALAMQGYLTLPTAKEQRSAPARIQVEGELVSDTVIRERR
jgi:prevent-host-death family protein